MNIDDHLAEIDRRLERLERLVFITYGDVRAVANYAYENAHYEVTADEAKRLPGMDPLDDREALAAGLLGHELVALKMSVRALKKQTRRDALTIIRDMVRRARASQRLEEAA